MVEGESGQERLVYKFDFRAFLPTFIRNFIFVQGAFERENEATRNYFYERFKGRIHQVTAFDHNSKEALFASDVQEIFFEMALVKKQELEGEPSLEKYESLVPKEFQQACHANVNLRSSKGELAHRIWELYSNKDLANALSWNYLRAHINDVRLPNGIVFPELEGFRYLSEKIKFQGGYAYLYEGGAGLQLHFMGTIPKFWIDGAFSTIKNDLLPRIGFEGIQSFLATEEAKNILSKEEKFEVLGFSLGGVYAQRLTLEYPDKISRCTTVCSPRVGDFNSTELEKFELCHILHQDDPIPAFGGKILTNNKTGFYLLPAPGAEDPEKIFPGIDPRGFFPLLMAFLSAAQNHTIYRNFAMAIRLRSIEESFFNRQPLDWLRPVFNI